MTSQTFACEASQTKTDRPACAFQPGDQVRRKKIEIRKSYTTHYGKVVPTKELTPIVGTIESVWWVPATLGNSYERRRSTPGHWKATVQWSRSRLSYAAQRSHIRVTDLVAA